MSDLVNCPVDFHRGVNKFGVFANAFRIVPDTGQECFLDFCIFSAQEERAEVVARIRIHHSFLPIIKSRLQESMTDVSDKPYVMKDGLLRTPEGGVVLFNPVDVDVES